MSTVFHPTKGHVMYFRLETIAVSFFKKYNASFFYILREIMPRLCVYNLKKNVVKGCVKNMNGYYIMVLRKV